MNQMGRLNRVGLVGLLLAVATLTGLAAEPTVIGKVVSAEGDVQAFDAENLARVLKLESEVSLGERIVTGVGASVKILLADDSIIAQGERSEIVLDEYVYKPDEKKGNAFMRATRGVFRIITGKITELNPEEFKVRSGLATIGIRGCEVGFRIAKDDEDIYVLELPRGKSIYIEREDGSGTGAMIGPSFVNVVEQGIVVSIHGGGSMTQRTFTPTELLHVFQGLEAGGSTEDTGGTSDNQRSQHRQPQQTAESFAATGNEAARTADLSSKAEDAATKTTTPASNEGDRGGTPQPPSVLPPPTSPPEVRPPTTSPPTLVGGNPELNDWEWGVWDDGTVQYNPNRYVGAEFLNRENVSSIMNGNVAYTLNGSGQAGAAINDNKDGTTKQVSGTVNLSVEVGATAHPTWGGTFDLNNGDGDRLSFTVDPGTGGTIGSDGHLVLSPEGGVSAYTMRVNGKEFDGASVTKQTVDGQLIKPSATDTGISGAAGEFHFDHGAEATVDGAFGVDF